MQPIGSRSSLLPSISPSAEFNITIIDHKTLIVRLTAELLGTIHDLHYAFRQLQKDPITFLRGMILQADVWWRRQLSVSNLIGLTLALFVVLSVILLVVVIDRGQEYAGHDATRQESSIGEVVMVDLKTVGDVAATGGIDPKASGRVGIQNGKAEGSGPKPQRAGGGGSGGNRDLTSAQVGAVPPPSVIPAPIPKAPPLNSLSLAAAGIDIDPMLWRDIKYYVYGDPRSQATTPSNGPGEDGGMGNNRGFGVGEGIGNGYGRGNNGNTGDGDRQTGCCGPGGAAGNTLQDRDRVLRPNEVDQKARLLSKPEPHYSEEARKSGVTGTVILRVIFSSTGQITQIRAVHTLPFGLTERAIAAAREIKFQPAIKGGRPVSVYMQLEYNFNLY
jgi:TonB family protein